MTLFRKSANQEDGELVPQRTILPELEFRLFLYQKGREYSQALPGSHQRPEGMC